MSVILSQSLYSLAVTVHSAETGCNVSPCLIKVDEHEDEWEDLWPG